jgi:hypothetical protein
LDLEGDLEEIRAVLAEAFHDWVTLRSADTWTAAIADPQNLSRDWF